MCSSSRRRVAAVSAKLEHGWRISPIDLSWRVYICTDYAPLQGRDAVQTRGGMGARTAEEARMVSVADRRLRDIIRERSLLTAGSFTLASGRASSLFFDMKPAMLDPEGANLIADAVLDRLDEPELDAVGGLVMGAVPIVAVVCAKSFERGRPLQVSSSARVKDHGTAKLIEGKASRTPVPWFSKT